MSILYAMRLHAKHVRNIFTGSPGCKLLFNFALLRLNLSTVTEILYSVVIIQQKVANSPSKLAVRIQLVSLSARISWIKIQFPASI